MTSNEVSAINLAQALREGVRLRPVEVVALLHNACEQLEGGMGTLPDSLDDIGVTEGGKVVLPRIEGGKPVRTGFADLLEHLLTNCIDPNTAVPAALQSLPVRLRQSSPSSATEVTDLLTILRWHLPADSKAVLRDLVTRAQLNSPHSLPSDVVESFATEDPMPTPPPAVESFASADVVPAGPPVVESFGSADTMPAAPPVVAHGRALRRLSIAALMLLAIFASGYVSYSIGRARVARNAATGPAMTEPAAEPSSPPIARRHAAPAATSVDAAGARPADTPPGRRIAHDVRPLNLPVSGGAFSPAFARNGELMFHAGRSQTGRLFEASLDDRGTASHVEAMRDDGGRSYHPRPSPDGRWIAFDSDRDGERGVYVASRNGAVQRVSGAGFATAPSWSPDMRWLAFVRAEPSRPTVWNLWLRDVATGELSRASRYNRGQVWAASWFPDSRSYCYSHEDRLFIASPETGTTRSFASPIAGRLIRTPAVSPDGKQIVFQVYRDGAWLLDVTSGQATRLLADPTAEEFAWSPEGRRIAYHSKRDGEWRIWMLGL